MPSVYSNEPPLSGMFRDVVHDAEGRVTLETPWQKNVIVDNCRRLLATFMHNVPATIGIKGLLVGAGLAAWDVTPPPAPVPGTTQLVDLNPFLVPIANLGIAYLDAASNVTATPTNRIQIIATLPGLPTPMPPWPNGTHPTGTLREFGLVGTLNGTDVLINYRVHTAIAKDPTSTLVRTIWLTF
jgi:hypothetical protein